MKSVQYKSTLFFYDGPQVFEARDKIGGHYVAVMVGAETSLETPPDGDRCLVVGVAPEQLRLFRVGEIDLRSLLLASDGDECYLTTVKGGMDEMLELDPLTMPISESRLLPDEGFLLHDNHSSDVLKKARERNNFVLEVAAEPPEAATEHRIHLGTLAGLLHHMQTMVKHAYRKAKSDSQLHSNQPADVFLDVVVPAAPGSFRVVLEGANMPDLFGGSELELVLPHVDELFRCAADPQETLILARQRRGHLAGAYLKFLRFLAKNRTGLRYSWAAPGSDQSTNLAVLERQTRPLIDALSSVEKLASEPIVLEGTFEKFNRNTGTWGLSNAEGMHSGKIKGEGVNLDGLEVGGSYRFHCDEEIEEIAATGEERRNFYLNEHEKI